ncbi:MAG TPA: hypothetical protein VFV38_17485 [Ktedonobacteraceae bacterium]|nr:hypothetical protein [Ktedonobacteraceae bacterium]
MHVFVAIQTTPESLPSILDWMGEVAAFAQVFTQTGILSAIIEQVRFARARMGSYDLIDFAVVLCGLCALRRTDLTSFLRPFTAFCRRVHGSVWPLSFALSCIHGQRCPETGSPVK